MTAPRVDVDSIHAQLRRILASDAFTRAERMSRFLRHVVEAQLAGDASLLKEIVIGVTVFDKGTSYDPKLDPIVRVEARRLRAKLRDYYAGAGRSDPIVIDLPT